MWHMINMNSDAFVFFKEIHSKTLKGIKMTLTFLRLEHSMLLVKQILKCQRTGTFLITSESMVKKGG